MIELGQMRRQASGRPMRALAASLFAPLLALAIVGAPSTSLAQPNIGATPDDNVNAGTYRQQGNTLNYTTVITNSGAANGTGVTLTNPAPSGTSLVAGSVTVTPIAFNDGPYSLTGNTPITISAASGVLANDIDPDSTTPASNVGVTVVSVDVTGTNGSVSMNANGSFTFTPQTGFKGTTTFTYRAHDAQGLDSNETGIVTMTVTEPIWYVDSAADAGDDGSFGNAFTTVGGAVAAAAANTNDPNGEVDDTIFVYNRGVSYSQMAGVALATGEQFLGDGSSLTSVNGNAIGASASNSVFSATAGQATLTLGQDNTVSGININAIGAAAAAIADNGGTVGTLHLINVGVISSNSGIVLNAGGTVDATGTNTITANNGTALNITNTTIGAAGLTFRSIAASSATNGIVLNNTGSTAGLTVTGTGTTDDSGGIIQNTSGSGIVLTNARFTSLSNVTIGDATTTPNTGNGPINFTPSIGGFGISMSNADDTTLTNVRIAKTGNSGIDGTGVTNLTISNSEILRAGDGNEENGLSFDDFAAGTENNLDGTVLIQDTVIDAYSEGGVVVENFTGTLNLTLSGVTFGRNKFETGEVGGLNPFGEEGLQARADGNSDMTITVTGNSLFDAVDGNGIIAVSEGTGTMNIAVTDTIIQNSDALGIVLFGGSGDHTSTIPSRMNFDIIGDWPGGASGATTSTVMVTGTNSTGISIQPNGNSLMDGTVKGVIVNGSTIGRGIEVLGDDASDAVIAIDNNKVSNTAFNGIFANTGDYGRLDIHIRNNNVSAPLDATPPSGLAVHGIEINPVPRGVSDPADFATITTLDISGNISAGNLVSAGAGYRLRQRAPDVTFRLERLGVNQTTALPVVAFIEAQNVSGNASVTVDTQYTAVPNGAALDPHTPPSP